MESKQASNHPSRRYSKIEVARYRTQDQQAGKCCKRNKDRDIVTGIQLNRHPEPTNQLLAADMTME